MGGIYINTKNWFEETGFMRVDWKYIFRRTGAYVLDVLIVYMCVRLIKKVTEDTIGSSYTSNMLQNALFCIYAVLLKGRTLGKKIFRLKVVDLRGGKPLFRNIVIREFTGRFLLEASNLIILTVMSACDLLDVFLDFCAGSVGGTILYYAVSLPWVLIVSFSCVMLFGDHRAIHDQLSGTRVI